LTSEPIVAMRRLLNYRTILFAPAALMLLFAAGCSTATASGVWDSPDLVGTVADVTGDASERRVLVHDVVMPASGYSAIDLFLSWPGGVGNAQVYFLQRDGRILRGTDLQIQPGSRLRAWTSGLERRSMPPQWDAVRVLVEPPVS
jgi:hypothetical protein